jgi:hypothetical protein
MKKSGPFNPLLLLFIGLIILTLGCYTAGSTVAYWRFEEGPAGTNVQHGAGSGVFSPDLIDSSGNGHFLSAWDSSQWQFRANVPYSIVPWTGASNVLSVKNVTGSPTMWNTSLATWEPAQWTIEATFKAEAGGWKTIVGRDSRGANTAGLSPNSNLAALYFQTTDNPPMGLAVKYVDKAGYWHDAVSSANAYTGFTYNTDPEGTTAPWYTMAATCDGRYLRLYLFSHSTPENGYVKIAETDMTVTNPGSTNTAMSKGAGDGTDWDAGNITVGRGLYGGSHGDRFYGYLDEVRLSDIALEPSAFLCSTDYADTVAYWRFEEGPADSPVSHGGLGNGVFYPGVSDVSGKGNHLSAWSETLGAHIYRNEVVSSVIPLSEAANNFCVQNGDVYPGMFTSSASADANSLMIDIEAWTPAVFTIEASFKPQSGGYRTIVGRDGMNVTSAGGNLAALYFQIQDNDSVAIKFADVSGYWHQAVSQSGIIQYDGSGHWYHMAAVCDGQSLKLYLDNVDLGLGYQLVAQTDMTLSGSPDTRLAADTTVGSNWHGGGWSVGRGLFGGNHTDRLLGYIDEVRISQAALEPSQFLFYEAQYAGVTAAPSDLVVHEEGATGGDLFFSLSSLPADDVVLTVAEQLGRGQVTLNQTTLTFTAANWNIPQAIHVTAVDDADLENAEHAVALSITVSSAGDADYDGLDVSPVIVYVADNECGAWAYAAADFTIDCVVDLDDLAVFAEGWLECSVPDQAGCIDYTE